MKKPLKIFTIFGHTSEMLEKLAGISAKNIQVEVNKLTFGISPECLDKETREVLGLAKKKLSNISDLQKRLLKDIEDITIISEDDTACIVFCDRKKFEQDLKEIVENPSVYALTHKSSGAEKGVTM